MMRGIAPTIPTDLRSEWLQDSTLERQRTPHPMYWYLNGIKNIEPRCRHVRAHCRHTGDVPAHRLTHLNLKTIRLGRGLRRIHKVFLLTTEPKAILLANIYS